MCYIPSSWVGPPDQGTEELLPPVVDLSSTLPLYDTYVCSMYSSCAAEFAIRLQASARNSVFGCASSLVRGGGRGIIIIPTNLKKGRDDPWNKASVLRTCLSIRVWSLSFSETQIKMAYQGPAYGLSRECALKVSKRHSTISKFLAFFSNWLLISLLKCSWIKWWIGLLWIGVVFDVSDQMHAR